MVRGNKKELFGHNEQQYVWRRQCEASNHKNTVPTVMHGVGSFMMWGCFTASGSGALKKIQILQETSKHQQEDWVSGAGGSSNRTMMPNTHQKCGMVK